MTLRRNVGLFLSAAMLLTACGPGSDGTTPPPPPPPENRSTAELPSCYGQPRIDATAPVPTKAIFVLVDQTTGLDPRLRDRIRTIVDQLLAGGTSFTISTFSAYRENYYATVLRTGTIEADVPVEDRADQSVPALGRLRACLRAQRNRIATILHETLEQATGVPASTFSSSEIMASLSQLSSAVRASPAREKIVLVVSDLLEHSSTTSFYANRNLRLIDPAAEMRHATASRLVGDFAEARLVVVGAGLLPPESAPDAGRDAQRLDALRRFWEEWFRQSRAELIAYGQPDPVVPIRWIDGRR
jgi:hypothetical protein